MQTSLLLGIPRTLIFVSEPCHHVLSVIVLAITGTKNLHAHATSFVISLEARSLPAPWDADLGFLQEEAA